MILAMSLSYSPFLKNFGLASLILGVLNIVFVLQYVHRLKQEKCECSESIAREVIYITAMLQALVVALGMLLSIFAFSRA